MDVPKSYKAENRVLNVMATGKQFRRSGINSERKAPSDRKCRHKRKSCNCDYATVCKIELKKDASKTLSSDLKEKTLSENGIENKEIKNLSEKNLLDKVSTSHQTKEGLSSENSDVLKSFARCD